MPIRTEILARFRPKVEANQTWRPLDPININPAICRNDMHRQSVSIQDAQYPARSLNLGRQIVRG